MSADVDVLIVGAGHAGLGVAARLAKAGRDVLIVDANAQVGDSWRARWASLRLFTPRFVNTLPGMPFPKGADPFPGKDEVAEYQRRYAERLAVPLRLGATVERVTPSGAEFAVRLRGDTLRAKNVVVATGAHHTPRIPAFASKLDPSVVQLHSGDYGRAGPLSAGPVLIVGARNSGVEIAMDLASTHPITISLGQGKPSHAPDRWRSPGWWRIAQFRSWLLGGRFPPGPWPWPIKPPGGKWIELDLGRAEREGRLTVAPRAVDARGDAIVFEGGGELRPRTVIWATGFAPEDSWIDVPQDRGAIAVARHRRGPVPGLWINRAALLGSLHWGSLDIASDIVRGR